MIELSQLRNIMIGNFIQSIIIIIILVPLIIIVSYRYKKDSIAFPLVIIFVFFVAMHRTKYTHNRGRNPIDNNQNYPVMVSYNYQQNQQKIKPRYCINCGTLIEQDSKFCSECGTNVI